MKSRLLLLIALTFLALPVAAQDFGSISGTVTAGDRPLQGVTMMAFQMNNNHREPLVTETGDDGTYEFPEVIAGEVVVQAVPANGAEPQHQRTEVAGNRNTVVDFNFGDDQQDEVGVVFGRVTSGDAPVAGAFVFLINPDGHRRMYSTQTNREGAYRIENVLAGQYIAHAQGAFGQMQDQQIEVAANEELEVNFQLQGDDEVFGGVEGTVTDTDGNPIARAQVIVMAMVEGGGHNGGGWRQFNLMTHTDAEGHYAIDEVPVGVHPIGAGKFGYEPFHGEVEIVENEVTVFDIVLEPFHQEDLVFGSVFGTVTDEAGETLPEAHVLLVPRGERGGNGWPHDPEGGRGQLVTFTDENGAYNFEEAPVGAYLARAAKRGFQPADQEIEVAEGEATEANFVLAEDEHGGGNGGGHEGERVELHGIAIVIDGDVADIYLLDTDADGAADYLLNFGPPDYDPGNGAARPESGDEIDITGMITGHMEPPLVLVFTINGQEWRNPDGGDHGGRPGGGNGWEGEDELELVEAEGTVMVNADGPWYHRYFLNVDENDRAEYVLFFGDDDYDPGNGVARPEDGDFVNIIGGLFQPREGLPVIVVYQLNGQLWREPGDTLELFWQDPNDVKDVDISLPISLVLVSAYPNPFNPKAIVSLKLPAAAEIRVSLVDLTGREVAKLASGRFEAGSHNLMIDGSEIKAGTYFLRVESANDGIVRKVTLLR